MNKLEVGMLIRTKQGSLGKIIKRYEVNGYYKIIVDIRNGFIEKHKELLFIKNLKGYSFNIIDLIEIGDYVNGTIVTKVSLDNIECNYIETDYSYNRKGLRNKDIKSIVTKEQFEAIKYEVK